MARTHPHLALLGITAVIGLAMCAPTYAASVTMKTGSDEGNYHNVICPAFAKHVAKSGISLTCETSAGSGENFDAVMNDGENVIGLGQMDVFGVKLNEAIKGGNEDAEESMATLGFIVPESLFCIASTNGPFPNSEAAWSVLNDDEPGDPFVISTYGENSGSAGTLEFLRQTFPNFAANTNIKHKNKFKHQIEMNKVLAGKRDAACFVTMANPETPAILDVLANEKFFFLPLSSPELSVVKIGKTNAYQIMNLPLEEGGLMSLFGSDVASLNGITTGVTVYMDVDSLDTKVYNAIAAAVKDPELLPADDSFIGQLAAFKTKALGALD